jgi:surface polysaccharide O-acyltransferase-like enzyme
VAGVAAVCVAGFALGSEPTREAAYRYGMWALLVCAALGRPGRIDPLTQALSPLLLGVYLVHPLLIRLLGGRHLQLWGDVPCALFFFALSLAAVAGMRRTPLRVLT